MRWDIAEKVRCDIIAWSGINFSGRRKVARIFPVGGLQGDEFESCDISSLMVVGPIGVRVVLMASSVEEDWESRPWRAICLVEGYTFTTKKGDKPAVRIPDLDWLDDFDARRSDPDFQVTYDQVAHLAEGRGWTYGRTGDTPLRGHVRSIKVDHY